MATKKQEITKHKATTSKSISSRSGTSGGVAPTSDVSQVQVFDIVPRRRVRADATSRPVITGNKPEVTDNTLATAPILGLKPHGELTIIPPSASLKTKADASSDASPTEGGVDVVDPLLDETKAVDMDGPGETKKVDKPTPSTDGNIDDDEALAKALQDDNPAMPQEHSDALKEEMKSIGEDGRTHHELYGGKPVIVVHKDHGTSAAVTWTLWFLGCVLLAVAIVDILLDAGIVKTSYSVPFTDFIK